MLDQLDALTVRMHELVAHVRQLREENHQLRTQLATAQRLDGLIARLPQEAAKSDGV
jgi:cell division septum initiation protein DivIVA